MALGFLGLHGPGSESSDPQGSVGGDPNWWWSTRAGDEWKDLTSGDRSSGLIDADPQAGIRAQQDSLAAMLRRQAEGRGVSVAQEQLRAGLDQNRAGAASIAVSQQGMSPAMAARVAADAQARSGAAYNRDAGVLRAQEIRAAQQSLGGLLSGMRQQDIGLATSQARLSLEDQRMKDQLAAQYMAAGMGANEANRQADLALEQMRMQRDMQMEELAQTERLQNAGYNTKILGGLAKGMGTMIGGMMGSDRTIKKKIKSADRDAKDFLDALAPSSYEYKEPDAPGRRPGKTYGVMAQDVKKSKVGRTFMTKTPDGKLALDIKGGLGALLATAASLGRRVNKLETAGATA
jgi:hypothetical protein